MAKCDHCHSRKGKRACPFLKGHICSTCCGENRGVQFDCPRDCPYFGPPLEADGTGTEASARTSGDPPAADGGASPPSPAASGPAPDFSRYQKFMGDDKRALADLMGRLEIAMAHYERDRHGLSDADALQALEYLRRRSSPILAVERFAPEMGVFLDQALAEMYRGAPAPRPYDLIEVLDHLIGTARNFGPAGSRLYLDQIGLLEARSREAGGEGKGAEPPSPASRIILPH